MTAQPLYSVRGASNKPAPHFAVVAHRLAVVVKILQEASPYESSVLKEARDECLLRALRELYKVLDR